MQLQLSLIACAAQLTFPVLLSAAPYNSYNPTSPPGYSYQPKQQQQSQQSSQPIQQPQAPYPYPAPYYYPFYLPPDSDIDPGETEASDIYKANEHRGPL